MARDLFHYAVRAALEKEKWVVTDDPLKVGAGGAKFEIDLGAERIVAKKKLRLRLKPLLVIHQLPITTQL